MRRINLPYEIEFKNGELSKERFYILSFGDSDIFVDGVYRYTIGKGMHGTVLGDAHYINAGGVDTINAAGVATVDFGLKFHIGCAELNLDQKLGLLKEYKKFMAKSLKSTAKEENVTGISTNLKVKNQNIKINDKSSSVSLIHKKLRSELAELKSKTTKVILKYTVANNKKIAAMERTINKLNVTIKNSRSNIDYTFGKIRNNNFNLISDL